MIPVFVPSCLRGQSIRPDTPHGQGSVGTTTRRGAQGRSRPARHSAPEIPHPDTSPSKISSYRRYIEFNTPPLHRLRCSLHPAPVCFILPSAPVTRSGWGCPFCLASLTRKRGAPCADNRGGRPGGRRAPLAGRAFRLAFADRGEGKLAATARGICPRVRAAGVRARRSRVTARRAPAWRAGVSPWPSRTRSGAQARPATRFTRGGASPEAHRADAGDSLSCQPFP